DFGAAGFLGRSSRKILARPDKPAMNALVLGKTLICPLDNRCRIRESLPHDQNCARFRIAVHGNRDHNAVLYFWLDLQRVLQVLGIDVHSRGSDDYIFLASFEKEI